MAKRIEELVDFYTVDEQLARKIQEYFNIQPNEENGNGRDYVYSLFDIPKDEIISVLTMQEEILPLARYYLLETDESGDAIYIRVRTFWKGAMRTIKEKYELREYLANGENWYCMKDN